MSERERAQRATHQAQVRYLRACARVADGVYNSLEDAERERRFAAWRSAARLYRACCMAYAARWPGMSRWSVLTEGEKRTTEEKNDVDADDDEG